MTTREQHRQAAAVRHDLDRHIVTIIQRGGDPTLVWQAIRAAITGHGFTLKQTPATAVVRRDCTVHPGTETPGGRCPSCGPPT